MPKIKNAKRVTQSIQPLAIMQTEKAKSLLPSLYIGRNSPLWKRGAGGDFGRISPVNL
jgi:hypothetical protein